MCAQHSFAQYSKFKEKLMSCMPALSAAAHFCKKPIFNADGITTNKFFSIDFMNVKVSSGYIHRHILQVPASFCQSVATL